MTSARLLLALACLALPACGPLDGADPLDRPEIVTAGVGPRVHTVAGVCAPASLPASGLDPTAVPMLGGGIDP